MKKAGPKSKTMKQKEASVDEESKEVSANGDRDADAEENGDTSDSNVKDSAKAGKSKRSNGSKSYNEAADDKSDDEDKDDEDYSDQKGSQKEPKKPAKKRKSVTKESKKGKVKRAKVAVKEEESEPEDQEFEVDKVVDHLDKGGKRQFKIRWKGFGPGSDTWEAEDKLNCPEAIKVYLDAQAPAASKAKSPAKKKTSKTPEAKKGKGKGKKPAEKKAATADESESEDETEEFEVDRIIEVHYKKSGKREFLIRWKGYSKGDDTWEPEDRLSCPDLITKFMAKVDKAKDAVERELRVSPKHTNRYTLSTKETGRRVSRRGGGQQRAKYYDFE